MYQIQKTHLQTPRSNFVQRSEVHVEGDGDSGGQRQKLPDFWDPAPNWPRPHAHATWQHETKTCQHSHSPTKTTSSSRSALRTVSRLPAFNPVPEQVRRRPETGGTKRERVNKRVGDAKSEGILSDERAIFMRPITQNPVLATPPCGAREKRPQRWTSGCDANRWHRRPTDQHTVDLCLQPGNVTEILATDLVRNVCLGRYPFKPRSKPKNSSCGIDANVLTAVVCGVRLGQNELRRVIHGRDVRTRQLVVENEERQDLHQNFRRNVETEAVSAHDKRDVWNFTSWHAFDPHGRTWLSRKNSLACKCACLWWKHLPVSMWRCARASNVARRLSVDDCDGRDIQLDTQQILTCLRRGMFCLIHPAACKILSSSKNRLCSDRWLHSVEIVNMVENDCKERITTHVHEEISKTVTTNWACCAE